jgi:hypothetical protein
VNIYEYQDCLVGHLNSVDDCLLHRTVICLNCLLCPVFTFFLSFCCECLFTMIYCGMSYLFLTVHFGVSCFHINDQNRLYL